MKNIHILPTDKPSRLIINWEKDLCYKSKPYLMEGTQNIYITSDEEIKEGDWYVNTLDEVVRKNNTINHSYHKKIILTTDNKDLINDGVQAIDDEFLEWFVKNPSCEEVEVKPLLSNNGRALFGYKIIIPKEEPKVQLTQSEFKNAFFGKEEPKQDKIMERFIANAKQETLEEAINREFPLDNSYKEREAMFIGAKWQQERSYSEEEVLEILSEVRKGSMVTSSISNRTYWEFDIKSEKKWFEQFKKE